MKHVRNDTAHRLHTVVTVSVVGRRVVAVVGRGHVVMTVVRRRHMAVVGISVDHYRANVKKANR